MCHQKILITCCSVDISEAPRRPNTYLFVKHDSAIITALLSHYFTSTILSSYSAQNLLNINENVLLHLLLFCAATHCYCAQRHSISYDSPLDGSWLSPSRVPFHFATKTVQCKFGSNSTPKSVDSMCNLARIIARSSIYAKLDMGDILLITAKKSLKISPLSIT